ncbi:hypothetical protein BBJ28_00012140 [Nothophytophthora sp. Chile5]|nr:hypothetical protein BBJ28_00012140 [Nothophytophthora sp. Chile5]
MLAALRSQVGALTLRPAAGSCLVGRVAKASLSTAGPTASEGEADATAEFLSATTPTEARTVKTMNKGIRGSPRKLTYLAQQATEAILQMKFSPKRKAEIFRKTVQNAINLADIKYQIEPENLMVAECFVNKGTFLKRLKIMGRGRSGVMHHPHTHVTVVLREFDPANKPLNRHRTKKLLRENAKVEASEE